MLAERESAVLIVVLVALAAALVVRNGLGADRIGLVGEGEILVRRAETSRVVESHRASGTHRAGSPAESVVHNVDWHIGMESSAVG